MKPATAKLVLSCATAAVGALGDIAGQLASGALTNAARPVLFGVGLGLFTRVAGRALEWVVERAAAGAPPEPPAA